MPEDSISIEVKGIAEVNRALYRYSQELGDKIVLKALREGAKVMQKQARANAPKRTGRLRKGIVVKNSKIYSKRRGRGTLGVFMTLRKGKGKNDPKDAFYGRWIEHGFRPRGGQTEVPGRRFIDKAFRQKRESAARLIILASERGAELVARKTGLR